MKNYKQKLSLLTIGTVILLGVSFVGAQTDTVIEDKNLSPVSGTGSSSFSGPCGAPGTCNAPEFLSASSTDQVKSGTLRAFGLRLKKFLFIGYDHDTDLRTLATGSASAEGLMAGINGTLGASKYCDESGSNCYTSDQVYDLIYGGGQDGLVCDANPVSSTLHSYNGGPLTVPYAQHASDLANQRSAEGYKFVNGEITYPRSNTTIGTQAIRGWNHNNISLPVACNSDQGCVLKQVVYRKKSVSGNSNVYVDYISRVRFNEYHEDATSGYWTSTDAPKGGRNGDTTSNGIFRGYGVTGSTGTVYQVILRDDYNGTAATKELSKMVIRPYDNWGSAGEEIYLCTYPADTAN